MTERQIKEAIQYATQLGKEEGTNAAAWWQQDAIGGRATGDTKATAQRVLDGLDEGDPEIIDGLPRPDLSGQWADTMSGPDLIRRALDEAGLEEDEIDDAYDGEYDGEICDAYENAFSQAVDDEVQRVCEYEVS